MKIKEEALLEIKRDYKLRRKLMEYHEISEYTLLRWLRENNPSLIKYNSLDIIYSHLNKDIDDIIER